MIRIMDEWIWFQIIICEWLDEIKWKFTVIELYNYAWARMGVAAREWIIGGIRVRTSAGKFWDYLEWDAPPGSTQDAAKQ